MKRHYVKKVPFVTFDEVPPGKNWHGTITHHLFSLTLKGGAEYFMDNKRFQVQVGDMLHFVPDSWQNWTAHPDKGWGVYYIIIDLPIRFNELLPENDLAPGIGRIQLDGEHFAECKEAFAKMDKWCDNQSNLQEKMILNQLEYILIQVMDQYPAVPLDFRIQKACNYLNSRIEKPTTLDDVVRAAALSKPRLSALFKATLGISPIMYLENLRMERAAQMLLFSALDIEVISAKLCYRDRKYFDKRFKRHWQVTPFKFRKGDGAILSE